MSQSKARAARKSSPTLREKLARKRAKRVPEWFPISDAGEQALEKLEKAEKQLQFGEVIANRQGEKSDIDLDRLRQLRDEAEAERDSECMQLEFRGLSEDERDALASEYMLEEIPENADEEERRRIGAANKQKIKEWTYAAMEAAVVDSDLTAEEWKEELTSDRWSAGDIDRVRYAIQRAYGAQPADGIPKG